jgi:hypothetical protein
MPQHCMTSVNQSPTPNTTCEVPTHHKWRLPSHPWLCVVWLIDSVCGPLAAVAIPAQPPVKAFLSTSGKLLCQSQDFFAKLGVFRKFLGELPFSGLLVMWQRANVAKMDCAICASKIAACPSAMATVSCQRSDCVWRLPRSAASSLDSASYWLSPEGGFDAWCRDHLFDYARMRGRGDIAALCLQAPISPRVTRKHVRSLLRCIRHNLHERQRRRRAVQRQI